MLGLGALLAQAEEKTKNPLIPAWNELIWGTIAFVLLLVILWRTGVFKRISDALAERARRIQGEIDKAEHNRAEAEKLQQQYRDRLESSREEADRIIEASRP